MRDLWLPLGPDGRADEYIGNREAKPPQGHYSTQDSHRNLEFPNDKDTMKQVQQTDFRGRKRRPL